MGAKGRNRYRKQRVWQDYKARGLVQVMVQGNPQTEVPQLVSPSLWVTFHCHTPTRTPRSLLKKPVAHLVTCWVWESNEAMSPVPELEKLQSTWEDKTYTHVPSWQDPRGYTVIKGQTKIQQLREGCVHEN